MTAEIEASLSQLSETTSEKAEQLPMPSNRAYQKFPMKRMTIHVIDSVWDNSKFGIDPTLLCAEGDIIVAFALSNPKTYPGLAMEEFGVGRDPFALLASIGVKEPSQAFKGDPTYRQAVYIAMCTVRCSPFPVSGLGIYA